MEGLASPFTAELWFAGDPKLGARDDVLKDMAAIQGDLDRLGEWGTRDLMKFIRTLVLRRTLVPEKEEPQQQNRLGTGWLQSSSAEKGLGVSVDSKLNVNPANKEGQR